MFALPWWYRLLMVPGLVFMAAFPLALALGGIAVGEYAAVGIGLVLAVLVSVGVLDSSAVVIRSAARAILDEHGIEAKPLLGRRTRLAWDEIGEVRRLCRRRPSRALEELVLVGADGQGSIAVSDALPRFDELVIEIERRTPNAQHTEHYRPFWKRELFPPLREI